MGAPVVSRKWKAIAMFVAIYIVVCIAGTVMSICAPVYRDGDFVPTAMLSSVVKLSSDAGEDGLNTFSLYFAEPLNDLVLVTTSQVSCDILAGTYLLSFIPMDGLTGTVRAAVVTKGALVDVGDAWRLSLSIPEGERGPFEDLSLCNVETVDRVSIVYNYCLPLVQGVYLAISAYGFLLYRSKRERPLLMFSLYTLLLFLWGLELFLMRAFCPGSSMARALGAVLLGASAAYGIVTCVCFCGTAHRGRSIAKWWYMPLVTGAALGLLIDALPPLFDSALIIMVYMAGGVVLLATSDGLRRLPRAVLFGLSLSQGLRTVFLICSLSALMLPIQFEIVRQMHLLAMPYVIGCLIDIGGAFSRRFREAEAQAVELSLINEELDRRVEERTRELVRQQELRASVLANLFHDCKTPLSIVQGAIARTRDDPTCQDGQIEVIESQITNLTDIVDELFAVVKLQDNTLLMDTEPVSLAPLLETILTSCAVEAAARGIQIKFSCRSSPVTWGDEMWLGRAFQNLVANAVNFSRPNGMVEIGLGDDGEMALITVEDHGVGIDPADIDKVFDRYYRTAKDRTSHQSSGLGLSIAQGVVRKHGGSISVKSELGCGTVFSVSLPIWIAQD